RAWRSTGHGSWAGSPSSTSSTPCSRDASCWRIGGCPRASTCAASSSSHRPSTSCCGSRAPPRYPISRTDRWPVPGRGGASCLCSRATSSTTRCGSIDLSPGAQMRLVSEAEVHAALDYPGLVEALRELYRRGVDLVEVMHLTEKLPQAGQNDWLILPAWQFG